MISSALACALACWAALLFALGATAPPRDLMAKGVGEEALCCPIEAVPF